jgi:peptidoglycan/LPS O-acetylase OafA/YrhL
MSDSVVYNYSIQSNKLEMHSSTALPARSPAIDLVKGLAIVSVIFLHTLPAHTLDDIGATLYISQAVPVFVFLLGFNAASSMRRRGARALRELYGRDYLVGRFDRVYVPFLVAFAVTMVAAILAHRHHTGLSELPVDLPLGLFPIDGPGNYFVTLLFEFTLVFPLVFWGLRRWPVRTLLLCLALNTVLEVMVPRVHIFQVHPYPYYASIARLLFLAALGGYCTAMPVRVALRSRWLWCGALLSAVFLVLNRYDYSLLSSAHLTNVGEPLLAAVYPAALVLLGVAFLPALTGLLPARGGAMLGRASYHIFLVQIAWFGFAVLHSHGLSALLVNLAVTLSLGVVFYELMGRVPLPSVERLILLGKSLRAQKVGA